MSTRSTKQTPKKRVVRQASSSNPNPDAIAALNAAVNQALGNPKSSSNPTSAAAAANPTSAAAAANPKSSSNPTSAAAAANPKSSSNPTSAAANPKSSSNPTSAAAAANPKSSSNPTSAAAAPKSSSNPTSAAAAANPKSSSNPTSAAAAANPKSSSNPTLEINPNIERNPNPNPSPRQWAAWVEKAKNHKWDQWSYKPSPPDAIIPSSPALFCKIHDELADVTPVDDVYAKPPCSLSQNRRFNLKLVNGYFYHSKRQMTDDGDTIRKIANSTAYWGTTSGWGLVAGDSGEVVGMCFPLRLKYKERRGQPKPPHGMWSAIEYVSINNMGTSSIVVMTCKNEEWIQLELDVADAEHKLARSYQDLLNAKHNKKKSEVDVANQEDSVRDNLAILGSKIEVLEVRRREIREMEDLFCEVQGLEPHNEQVGDPLQTFQVVDALAPSNLGSVTSGNSEVIVEIVQETSSVSAVAIDRDYGEGSQDLAGSNLGLVTSGNSEVFVENVEASSSVTAAVIDRDYGEGLQDPAGSNIGLVTSGNSEVIVGNAEAGTSVAADVIDRDYGEGSQDPAGGYFSMLLNKKEEKERRKVVRAQALKKN